MAELGLSYPMVLNIRHQLQANAEREQPAIVGTVGRESGQARIRVVIDTTGATLAVHVHRFTQAGSHLYTDENLSYHHVLRPRSVVCHSHNEWARDDDDDGIWEVHVNSTEGLWTDVRIFLRPFKGVHKMYLAGYVAFAEFKRNLKAISPAFISRLVALHNLLT